MPIREAVVVERPAEAVDRRPGSLEAAIHAECVKLAFPELVIALTLLLGKKLTAYVASVKSVRTVENWMTGTEPYKGPDTRLRTAYQVAKLISTRYQPQVIQSWFMGLNPDLDDRAAATLLREGEIEVIGPAVLRAARAFISG